MRFVVIVRREPSDSYAYGPFYSKVDAARWAEAKLTSYNWTIAQYVDKSDLE